MGRVRQGLRGIQVIPTLDGLLWLAEAILEASGAWFFGRRRISVLWIWLGFRATADVICFAILELSGYRAYVWADHAQRNIQYALFAAACVYAASQIIRELPRAREFYIKGIIILTVLAVAQVNSVWPMPLSTFYGFETWAEMILAGFVAVGLGMASGRAPRPWGLIGVALVVMGGSDGLLTLLRQHGYRLEAWYPAGAILSLGMLAWAGWRDYRLSEFRRELPPKMEPTSSWYHFKQAKEM